MLLVILTFCINLSVSSIIKKHVPNSVYPNYIEPPEYNISNWVNKLNLQRCAIVEIGEEFAALFVEAYPENHPSKTSEGITEYFLGICDVDTLFNWTFCGEHLSRRRSKDCIFKNDSVKEGVRVHRRLCDIPQIIYNDRRCSCSNLGNEKLFGVIGFPTCFLPPIPQTICDPFNVCGLTSCTLGTAAERVHTVACNPNCFGGQPFCESTEEETSAVPEISSFWSDWRQPMCEDTSCSPGMVYTEAVCINRNTGEGAIDCLGPGTSCCSADETDCKCRIFEEDGVLKIFKTFIQIPVVYEKRSDYIAQPNLLDIHVVDANFTSINKYFPLKKLRKFAKMVAAIDEDYEDDEDVDDKAGEDVAIEEDTELEGAVSTAEVLEKIDLHGLKKEEANFTEHPDDATTNSRSGCDSNCPLLYTFLFLFIFIKA